MTSKLPGKTPRKSEPVLMGGLGRICLIAVLLCTAQALFAPARAQEPAGASPA